MLERISLLNTEEQENLKFHHWQYERNVINSQLVFAQVAPKLLGDAATFISNLEKTIGKGVAMKITGPVVYKRNEKLKGPMSVFGYDYFEDHFGDEKSRLIKVFSYNGLWGSGGEYAYEILNLVDGHRTAADIRNTVSAEFGPIPVEVVNEFLQALVEINVIVKM